ncbi:hypothetical protein RC1_3010 [Rhodospirillum centenum SW]|uniref:Uncharacterized protein n=1 Tax=Rhodospirillum centenum (strain ATCC 51521 / SW) TaxID=414684 RepID=B6IVQ4_RHOCS|nr:hypothetical protein RC1_3010 [Rhodospirillum centenum SW]
MCGKRETPGLAGPGSLRQALRRAWAGHIQGLLPESGD